MFGNHEIAVDQDSAVVTKEMWSTMRQTLAAQSAPVQEPVAWSVIGKVTDWSKDFHPYRTQIHQRPVYTTPPAQPAMNKLIAPALAAFMCLSLLLAYQLNEARAGLAVSDCAAPEKGQP
jgi:hypothetical protein